MLAVSCGGSTSTTPSSSGVGPTGPTGPVGTVGPVTGTSDSGLVGASGCGAASPAPTSIAGTWDVQGSTLNATPATATLVIDASHFTYAATGGDSLTFAAQGSTLSLVWQVPRSDAVPIVSTHAVAPFDQGIIPLALGGSWTFTSSDPGSSTHCEANLGVPQFTASCSNTSGFPSQLPDLDGNVTGARTSTQMSVFGELGGTWHIAGSGAGSCDAMFAANVLTVTCADVQPWDGSASLTFCDGIAAGSTSAGVEFSAHRR
jgi:hypothetical protein